MAAPAHNPPHPAATDAASAPARMPRHVAIVMDGNGRWAQARRRPRSFGHRAGVKAVRGVVEFCLRERIGALTLFAFSSENWQRPAAEVGALMNLFLRALDREVDQLHDSGVRVSFIGDARAFPDELQQRMRRVEQRTAGNSALALNVAANYGGRWDVANACRLLAEDVAAGRRTADSIDVAAVQSRLSLSDLPEPDLFIRTGGDQRISNFLLWQLAYAELHFTDVLWPDFDAAAMRAALDDFAGRERRFGKTSAQVRREVTP